jgi:Raf kinase inhibitor-like YbhB/YbcL family protein
MTDAFQLIPTNAMMTGPDEYAFPANSLPPTNQSPSFKWTGVPSEAKSLALVFTDLNRGAYKWVVWDILPSVSEIPASVSDRAMPMEIAGASQLGSVGNQGYAGPCCADRVYDFVLWALDVDKLPDASGKSTAELRQTLLPMHSIAMTKPVKMRIAQ